MRDLSSKAEVRFKSLVEASLAPYSNVFSSSTATKTQIYVKRNHRENLSGFRAAV